MSPDGNAATPQSSGNWRRGFWSLIATQFQGAFNENALKFLTIYLILAIEKDKAQREQLEFLVGALFAATFILFSLSGGYLADRFSKRSVTIWTKVFEVGVMVLAVLALVGPNFPLALAAIFLVCTQGALFGPSKYGLLPELLPQEELSWGNGVLELGTFLGIIAGSVCGAFLADAFAGHQVYSGVMLFAFTFIGLICSLGICRVPAADPAKRFRLAALIDVWSPMKLIRGDRVLWLAVLGNTYFFFVAALLQFNIFLYGQDVLHLDSTHGGLLQAAVAIGIGVGSLTAGFLSGGKIEYGLIPLGALGISVLGLCLAIPGLSFAAVLALLAALGFAGGFFIVPISALIQHIPEEQHKGGVLGAANWLSFVGVGVASGAYYAVSHWVHLSPGGIFLWASLATLAATGYVLYLLPDSLLRLLLWAATHTLYRLDVAGRENVPARGGALLVPNHVSMADGAFLIASLDRPVRLMMFKGTYDHPLVKPFAKMLRVIPNAS
jgi:acyl-[acyl-carrier-protein]-phospholipid O-acyltransferase/long-chain-fatty-acid--[acyl-carrier-protein] ligase